jgi:predicted GNAT family N-acyltransferase
MQSAKPPTHALLTLFVRCVSFKMKMPEKPAFTVIAADWSRDHETLSQIRFNVFVREQGVPPEIELDAIDADSALVVHAIAYDAESQPIGTGRLILEGAAPRIGRMAVLRQWRGSGVGKAILDLLCDEAKSRGYAAVLLHSQTHATPFYYKQGFLSHGDVFTEAGIPHQEMRRAL